MHGRWSPVQYLNRYRTFILHHLGLKLTTWTPRASHGLVELPAKWENIQLQIMKQSAGLHAKADFELVFCYDGNLVELYNIETSNFNTL